MSKVHITANIRCPYYKYETAGSVIHCHGARRFGGLYKQLFQDKTILKDVADALLQGSVRTMLRL